MECDGERTGGRGIQTRRNAEDEVLIHHRGGRVPAVGYGSVGLHTAVCVEHACLAVVLLAIPAALARSAGIHEASDANHIPCSCRTRHRPPGVHGRQVRIPGRTFPNVGLGGPGRREPPEEGCSELWQPHGRAESHRGSDSEATGEYSSGSRAYKEVSVRVPQPSSQCLRSGRPRCSCGRRRAARRWDAPVSRRGPPAAGRPPPVGTERTLRPRVHLNGLRTARSDRPPAFSATLGIS